MKLNMIFLTSLVLIGTLIAETARSQPGAFEINQACVEVGCFAGDPKGFPIEINSPGSFILTSNLQVTDPLESAIRVSTSDVSIDLGGFTVQGPRACPGELQPCAREPGAGTLSGAGIAQTGGLSNIRIKNGSVRGFHGWGIAMERDSLIFDVHVSDNFVGIGALPGTIIERSTFVKNDFGVDSIGAMIIDSTFRENRVVGVKTSESTAGLIDGINVYENMDGVRLNGAVSIRNSNVTRNAGYGIRVQSGGGIIQDSVISINELGGIALLNIDEKGVLISGTSLTLNGPDGAISPQIIIGTSSAGFVDGGGNMCGDSATCR